MLTWWSMYINASDNDMPMTWKMLEKCQEREIWKEEKNVFDVHRRGALFLQSRTERLNVIIMILLSARTWPWVCSPWSYVDMLMQLLLTHLSVICWTFPVHRDLLRCGGRKDSREENTFQVSWLIKWGYSPGLLLTSSVTFWSLSHHLLHPSNEELSFQH